MTDSSAPLPWKHISKTLTQYAPLWGGTVVLFTVFGIGYALFSSDYWSASQPLVLRDEATGSVERLGRFGSQTQMKAAQETILEMATNYEVVAEALRAIGPEDGSDDPQWPSSSLVRGIANHHVNVRAPQGSEFGNTEVVYLQTQATTPERAAKLCQAVYESLAHRLRTVRQLRADSIVEELRQARELAAEKLADVTSELKEIEIAFGSDLADLRSLSETFGDGGGRRLLDETLREQQAAELELEQLESLHQLLVAGREDPQKLLVSGGDLLSAQPSLLRMKDGLIQAQLESSQLSGRYTDVHPRLRAAIETENEIRQKLQKETGAVVDAMQPQLTLGRDKVKRLQQKQQRLTERLDRLAHVRADYAHLASEVKHRTDLLAQADKALTEAQASSASSTSVNLLAELGPPVVSDSPIGTSGSIMTLGSATAGLLFGLGAVFLVAPGPNTTGRGRRWSDIISGRRATDQGGSVSAQAVPPGVDRRANRSPGIPQQTGSPATVMPTPVDRRASDQIAPTNQPSQQPAAPPAAPTPVNSDAASTRATDTNPTASVPNASTTNPKLTPLVYRDPLATGDSDPAETPPSNETTPPSEPEATPSSQMEAPTVRKIQPVIASRKPKLHEIWQEVQTKGASKNESKKPRRAKQSKTADSANTEETAPKDGPLADIQSTVSLDEPSLKRAMDVSAFPGDRRRHTRDDS